VAGSHFCSRVDPLASHSLFTPFLISSSQELSRIVCHSDSNVIYIGAMYRRPETYLEGLVVLGGSARGSRRRINLLSCVCRERVAIFTAI
jgi:hypothetical protein